MYSGLKVECVVGKDQMNEKQRDEENKEGGANDVR